MTIKTEHRILIALDAHETSEESLMMLANMAARLHASLAGLFIEDSLLARAATLPFMTEINRFSAQERLFQSSTLMQLNRSSAAKIQQLLEQISARYQIPCSLTIEPGELLAKVLTQEGADIFFPLRKRCVPLPERPSLRLQQLLHLTLVYEDSPQFDRALEMTRLLSRNGMVSEITIISDTLLPKGLLEQLPHDGVKVTIQKVTSLKSGVRTALRQCSSSLLLIPRQQMPYDELAALFNQVATPFLLIS